MKAKKTDWPNRVKAIRQAMELTQDEFASVLGLETRSAVSQLEIGARIPKGPLARVLEALEENPRIFSKCC